MTKNNIWVLYSTFPNAVEALSVANELVEKRLIACANLLENGMSVYRWQGGVQHEKEVVMVAKTSESKLQDAIKKLAEMHSYQLPAITAYPVTEGYAPYLQWILDETA